MFSHILENKPHFKEEAVFAVFTVNSNFPDIGCAFLYGFAHLLHRPFPVRSRTFSRAFSYTFPVDSPYVLPICLVERTLESPLFSPWATGGHPSIFPIHSLRVPPCVSPSLHRSFLYASPRTFPYAFPVHSPWVPLHFPRVSLYANPCVPLSGPGGFPPFLVHEGSHSYNMCALCIPLCIPLCVHYLFPSRFFYRAFICVFRVHSPVFLQHNFYSTNLQAISKLN